MSSPNWEETWEICSFVNKNGKRQLIEKDEVINTLQSGVKLVGEKRLGLVASDIQSHSVRTSFVLRMAILKQPDYIIMLLGRWKSDKFMDYVRHQVLQFTKGVADKMTKINDFASIRL